MKRNRSPTSKNVTLCSSIALRSVLDRFSIGSRSIFVHPSFILRSFSVRESKIDRRLIEERTENHRRINGDSSEARRRCIETLMGNQGKGDPNNNFIFYHLNSNYYGKTYWNYFQTQRLCR